jgi:hypothetical protein
MENRKLHGIHRADHPARDRPLQRSIDLKVLSDNLHIEKIGDKRIIGDKKPAIDRQAVLSQ